MTHVVTPYVDSVGSSASSLSPVVRSYIFQEPLPSAAALFAAAEYAAANASQRTSARSLPGHARACFHASSPGRLAKSAKPMIFSAYSASGRSLKVSESAPQTSGSTCADMRSRMMVLPLRVWYAKPPTGFHLRIVSHTYCRRRVGSDSRASSCSPPRVSRGRLRCPHARCGSCTSIGMTVTTDLPPAKRLASNTVEASCVSRSSSSSSSRSLRRSASRYFAMISALVWSVGL
mmetsp:Transcript_20528/g.69469  ORF Transcript_20528/g.69469 Transcript_20528/m.69469 type:complete len:233 (+) Transcript_20528:258-956(+)